MTVAAGAATDTQTIELAPPAGPLGTLRLEALPDDALPGKGPGHAAGNFVITRLSARLEQPNQPAPVGRYVRIELPGKGRMLSLAEVQIFQGSENVARAGAATQSSTDFGGNAELAIDGNSSGDYHATHSTTHTAVTDDPWWEVDLKADLPLDRIVVWNRTDNGLGPRLAEAQVIVLDGARQPVWRQTLSTPPDPSVELSLSAAQAVDFGSAVSDYSQPEFAAADVLVDKSVPTKGWAVGGQTGQSHTLGLATKSPLEIAAGSKLIVTIEYAYKTPKTTLGRFRLSTSNDGRAMQSASTPPAVIDAPARGGGRTNGRAIGIDPQAF